MKRTKNRWIKWAPRLGYGVSLLTIALPARAFAAVAGDTGSPCDLPFTTYQADLQGRVAHMVIATAIIGSGITWAVSEDGTSVRRLSAIAFGGATAVGAMALMPTLFPAAGALF
jgi:hypothetical protein